MARRRDLPMSLDELARFAGSFDGVEEGVRWNNRTWLVHGKGFVWERPFSKADVKRLVAAGEPVPSGPIVAVVTEDLGEKEAELAEGRPGVFTIAHFEKYPALLIELDVASRDAVEELVTTAYLAVAPPGVRAPG